MINFKLKLNILLLPLFLLSIVSYAKGNFNGGKPIKEYHLTIKNSIMENEGIGYVRYHKNFATGKMDALWSYHTDGQFFSGTGIATGSQGNTFAGEYEITYYTDGTTESSVFKLIIIQEKNQFMLQWFQDGVLKCSGIGSVEGDVLTAGWRESR
ncbi:hypothetical protein OIU83_07970 [Flavobacterium sp. LS1R49]|uniref:Uncharacterized protein n=1 Tax=Flavobacterium shii TaxID=2987687 RepID=A0A9X3C713_9FLAO|nr:hypothetical protein [Flavobacterium shii]MCV9927583.1 hypothetical protein [Flavobacterium shii]